MPKTPKTLQALQFLILTLKTPSTYGPYFDPPLLTQFPLLAVLPKISAKYPIGHEKQESKQKKRRDSSPVSQVLVLNYLRTGMWLVKPTTMTTKSEDTDVWPTLQVRERVQNGVTHFGHVCS